jgi:hypothetical protein
VKLPNITGLVKVGKNFIMTYRPELLLGAAVTTSIGGAVLAAKGGYEARGIVDAAEAEKGEKLEVKEKIQLTWLCYMPAALTTTTAVGSIAGLHLVHIKDKKAMATAALAAIDEVKNSAKAFEQELTEVLAPDEKEDIQGRIMEKNADPETGIARMQNTDGEIEEFYLVRDGKTGRDIWSNQHRIEDAVIEVNNVINGSDSVELNHFYRHAGFGLVPDGYELGWSGALLSLEWDTTVRDDGRPVRQFTFRPKPEKGFDKAH